MSTLARIRLVHGDITKLDDEAIVTAANSALCGGGGVDGAVHNAAGPELVAASMNLAPCPAGEARLTDGFNLRAKYVIHAVGPIFKSLEIDSPTLASAYSSGLSLAAQHQVDSIAFPCISTGVYGFPPEQACEIAIRAVVEWLKTHEAPSHVTFCCFEQSDYERYNSRLTELGLVS